MKNKHRLMKIVQIQNNYQKHRQRLLSIQHFDTAKKQHISTLKPTEAVITYKQSRLKADIYNLQSKSKKIQHENFILLNHIEKQSAKSPKKMRESLSRSPSMSSIRSSHSQNKLLTQNSQYFKKINNTTSIYSKLRTERTKNDRKLSSKQEILNLLVNQLGVKPTVLFPALASNNRHILPNYKRKIQNRNITFHFNNLQKKKQSNSTSRSLLRK